MSNLTSAVAQTTLSISTVAQGRSDTYGVFSFNGMTIGILIVIMFACALVMVITRFLRLAGKVFPAVLLLLSDMSFVVLMLTWWTARGVWGDPTGDTQIWVGFLSLILVIGVVVYNYFSLSSIAKDK